MHKIDDLAAITLEILKNRFPSDIIYARLYNNGSSIYVNHVCYMSTDRDSNVLKISKFGVVIVDDYSHEVSAADPQYFDKVIDITMQNLIYYERYHDQLAKS